MQEHLPLKLKRTAADELPAGDRSGGGFALRYWEEARSDVSPNDTTPVHSWTVKLVANPSLDANIDATIRPKGNGSIIAAVPDATSTGGDKRGLYSVDWQLNRNNADEVVGSDYSGMAGGNSCAINRVNDYCFIGGGSQNAILTPPTVLTGDSFGGSNSYSAIVGGNQNEISGNTSQYSVVAGGDNNKIQAGDDSGGGGDTSYGVIGGGSSNKIEAINSTDHTANALYNAIVGGSTNIIRADATSAQINSAYNFIGGGDTNLITTTDDESTGRNAICGGGNNEISGNAEYSFIGGGNNNTVTGKRSAILGGKDITVTEDDTTAVTGSSNGSYAAFKTVTGFIPIVASPTSSSSFNIPAKAIIIAVAVRTSIAVTCTATYTVGDGGSATRYSTAAVSKVLGSTDKGTKAGAYYNATATPVVITPDTTPSDSTGEVSVAIHYIDIMPPTT